MDSYLKIKSKVDRTKKSWRKLIWVFGISVTVVAGLGVLLAGILFDNLFHLPAVLRIAVFGAIVIASAGIAYSFLIKPMSASFNDSYVASHIEKKINGINNRVINTMQIGKSREGHNEQFVDALLKENERESEKIDFEMSVDRKPAYYGIFFGFIVIAVAVVYLLLFPKHFINASVRIIMPLKDLPPVGVTYVQVYPGDCTLLNGEKLDIEAVTSGDPVFEAVLSVSDDGKIWKNYGMGKRGGRYFYTIESVVRPLSYKVETKKGSSKTHSVKVTNKSFIKTIKVTYRLPEYLGGLARTVENADGNVQGLAGSDVEVEFTINNALKSGEMTIYGKETGMEITGKFSAKSSFKITGQGSYRVNLIDENGYFLANPPEYSISAVYDGNPLVSIERPGRDESISNRMKLPILVSAGDDFGLKEVVLKYRVNNSKSEQILKKWSASVGMKFEGEALVSPETLNLKKGDWLTYYAVAVDRKEKPGVAMTKEYKVEIMSEEKLNEATMVKVEKGIAFLEEIIRKQQENMKETDILKEALVPSATVRLDDENYVKSVEEKIGSCVKAEMGIRTSTLDFSKNIMDVVLSIGLDLNAVANREMSLAVSQLEKAVSGKNPIDKRIDLRDAYNTQEHIIEILIDNLKKLAGFKQRLELQRVFLVLKAVYQEEKNCLGVLRDYEKNVRKQNLKEVRSSQSSSLERIKWVVDRSDKLGMQLGETDVVGKIFMLLSKSIIGKSIPAKIEKIINYVSKNDVNSAVTQNALVVKDLEDILKIFEESMENVFNATMAQLEKLLEGLEKESVFAKKRMDAKKTSDEDKKKAKGTDDDMMQNLAKGMKRAMKDMRDLPKDNRIDPSFVKELEAKTERIKDLQNKNVKDSDKKWKLLEEYLDMKKYVQGRTAEMPINDYFLAGGLDPKSGNWDDYRNAKGTSEADFADMKLPEEFQDLIGDLLEEQEKLSEDYVTSYLEYGFDMQDVGAVGAPDMAGGLMAARGKTGNKLPKDQEIGGRSGAGRSGKTFGELVGNEAKDMKGASTPTRGNDSAYQKGFVPRKKVPGDPGSNASTAKGGKVIDYGSSGEAGEVSEEDARDRGDPLKEEIIRESGRPGTNAQLEEMMRDYSSRQEQVSKRAERLQKNLKKIFMPTGRLEENIQLMREIEEEMKKPPTEQLWDKQQKLLNSLQEMYDYYTKQGNLIDVSKQKSKVYVEKVLDPRKENVPKEYRKYVESYFKFLSEYEVMNR